MSKKIGSAEAYQIDTSIFNDRFIQQDISMGIGGFRELLHRRIFDVQEEQIRLALITLGWTPPQSQVPRGVTMVDPNNIEASKDLLRSIFNEVVNRDAAEKMPYQHVVGLVFCPICGKHIDEKEWYWRINSIGKLVHRACLVQVELETDLEKPWMENALHYARALGIVKG